MAEDMTREQLRYKARFTGDMFNADFIIEKYLQQFVENSLDLIRWQCCSNADILFAILTWLCHRYDKWFSYYLYFCSKK